MEALLDAAQPNVRPFPTKVAHYTALRTLLHLFPENPGTGWGSLRATNVRYLNDRRELDVGIDHLMKAARQARVRPGVLATLDGFRRGDTIADAYSISFSGNADEIGQWRGYADDGMGVSVATEADSLRRAVDVAGPVLYAPRQRSAFARKIVQGVLGLSNAQEIAQTLLAAASFMKHEGFAPEREYRALVFGQGRRVIFRESGQRIVSSIDVLDGRPGLPLAGVLIGPGWQLMSLRAEDVVRHHVPLALRQFLQARGQADPRIVPSGLPYDPR